MNENKPAAWTRRSLVQGIGMGTAALAQSPPSNRPVRIGIVGGRFGATFQWHLHPGAKVTAVCDVQPAALQRLSEVYRCSNTFSAFRDLLKHPELDAVGVFTPAPLHAWMAIEAMKAGKHVISAVPAGLSAEQLEEILETVKRTGRRYMMAETSYYRPEVITCREWAREGRFGTIFHSEAEYHHEGLIPLMFDERGLPTWRHGLPPMLYPTHCTGIVIPVTGRTSCRSAGHRLGGWARSPKDKRLPEPFLEHDRVFQNLRRPLQPFTKWMPQSVPPN